MSGDQCRVTVTVPIDPAHAFRLFTEQIDLWWQRGPRFRHMTGPAAALHIEPGLGGRIFERADDRPAAPLFEIGRIGAWEPPRRFLFSWRIANFAPDEQTEVEVCFDPVPGGTAVTVTHRGWAALPPQHPARHGLQGAAFARSQGLWWAQLLEALRRSAATGSAAS